MLMSSLDNNALYTLYRDDPQGSGRAAFDELASRHRDRMVARICKRLNTLTSVADDILQNVFITLMQQAHKFDPAKSDVVGWMNWLADNRSRNEKRDRFRRPVMGTDYVTPSNDGYLQRSCVLNEAAGREEEPDYDAVQQELVDEFWNFAATLEPSYRETLVLVYVNGRTQTETARIQGIRRTTVMRRLHSILPKLRAAVGDEIIDLRCSLERRKRKREITICA